MARVNVETETRSDPRFRALVRKLGNEDQALGMLVRFWAIAQKYWGDECSLVPENVFALEEMEVLVTVDLAERRSNGIYCRGSEKHFDWYLQKCRAAKKSAVSRSNGKRVPLQRNECSVTTEPLPRSNGTDAPLQPLALALALAPALDINLSPYGDSHTASRDDVAQPAERENFPGPKDLADTWNAHCGTLPKIEALNDERKRKARARLREKPDLAYWQQIAGKLAADPFCTGQNDRGWRANFDFFIRPNTHLRISEGQLCSKAQPVEKESWLQKRKREALEREQAERGLKNAE